MNAVKCFVDPLSFAAFSQGHGPQFLTDFTGYADSTRLDNSGSGGTWIKRGYPNTVESGLCKFDGLSIGPPHNDINQQAFLSMSLSFTFFWRDAELSIELSVIDGYTGLCARIQSGFSPSELLSRSGYIVETNGGTVRIVRVDNNVDHVLATTAHSVSNGDRLGFRLVGSTLEAWVKHSGIWSLVLSTTDTTYNGYTSGPDPAQPGLVGIRMPFGSSGAARVRDLEGSSIKDSYLQFSVPDVSTGLYVSYEMLFDNTDPAPDGHGINGIFNTAYVFAGSDVRAILDDADGNFMGNGMYLESRLDLGGPNYAQFWFTDWYFGDESGWPPLSNAWHRVEQWLPATGGIGWMRVDGYGLAQSISADGHTHFRAPNPGLLIDQVAIGQINSDRGTLWIGRINIGTAPGFNNVLAFDPSTAADLSAFVTHNGPCVPSLDTSPIDLPATQFSFPSQAGGIVSKADWDKAYTDAGITAASFAESIVGKLFPNPGLTSFYAKTILKFSADTLSRWSGIGNQPVLFQGNDDIGPQSEIYDVLLLSDLSGWQLAPASTIVAGHVEPEIEHVIEVFVDTDFSGYFKVDGDSTPFTAADLGVPRPFFSFYAGQLETPAFEPDKTVVAGAIVEIKSIQLGTTDGAEDLLTWTSPFESRLTDTFDVVQADITRGVIVPNVHVSRRY